ncbi:MAG: AAA family ATPase [Clostridia bacterium]|nr:AAA family ATPase [Clostridia bacterium]
MKILEVYIKNFRGIKELKAQTNSNLVIIEGDRGEGKTSFISAIKWCLCVAPRNINFVCFQNDKERKVLLKIEKDSEIFDLEICDNNGKREHYITINNTKIRVNYREYIDFVKNKVIKNPCFDMNFIDSLYYGYNKHIGLTLSDAKKEKINDIADKLGFPIPERKLVFDNNLDCQIYVENRKLSGGFYSSGDNVLRMTIGKMIAVKFLEEIIAEKRKQEILLPIFLDDVFLMISEEYVMLVCKYLQKFNNQLFITNIPSNKLFFDNEKISVVDLKKSKIS